jgi:2-octaprenyl-6-methoxyphenol hydroxylase
MLHDVIIVGAGPVGATLGLALAEGGVDAVALDARPAGEIARGDRSLALSHGSRLIFERIGIWKTLAAEQGAVTPITEIDISQRGGFGGARLRAIEQGLTALGYVVSYRALQGALDAALVRAGVRVEHEFVVEGVASTPAYASVEGRRDGADSTWTGRLAVVADGSGAIAGVRRRRHEYKEVALVAKVSVRGAAEGVAFERFTDEGPMALLPEGDHFGLVWTTTPDQATTLVAMPEEEFLAALRARFGMRAGAFTSVTSRRCFPLALEWAVDVVSGRSLLIGNAAQSLHPVAGQGFNLGVRDAYELAQELLATPRDWIGSPARLAQYARRRRIDRLGGIAFTHGLLGVFGGGAALLRWPRGLALTLLDSLPPFKRAFTNAMLFGMR